MDIQHKAVQPQRCRAQGNSILRRVMELGPRGRVGCLRVGRDSAAAWTTRTRTRTTLFGLSSSTPPLLLLLLKPPSAPPTTHRRFRHTGILGPPQSPSTCAFSVLYSSSLTSRVQLFSSKYSSGTKNPYHCSFLILCHSLCRTQSFTLVPLHVHRSMDDAPRLISLDSIAAPAPAIDTDIHDSAANTTPPVPPQALAVPPAVFLVLFTLAMPLPLSLPGVTFVLLRVIWVALLLWYLPFNTGGIYYAAGPVATILLWILSWCDGGTRVSLLRVGVGSMAATGAYLLSTFLRWIDLWEMWMWGRVLLLVVSRTFLRKIYQDPHSFRSAPNQPLQYS
ncbi:hypothetical protein C8R45DRAFT_955173 [Mycena sanguinolenta]|nr:hypothetical protein C8R45DRAFT_955173 [Mycena sanguinolenta]